MKNISKKFVLFYIKKLAKGEKNILMLVNLFINHIFMIYFYLITSAFYLYYYFSKLNNEEFIHNIYNVYIFVYNIIYISDLVSIMSI